jgi:hypothetical protein
MRVVFTSKATEQNEQNISYLLEFWSIKVANDYLDKFDKMISLLEKGIILGKLDEFSGMDKYHFSKTNSSILHYIS